MIRIDWKVANYYIQTETLLVYMNETEWQLHTVR